MSPRTRYGFWIDPHQLDGLRFLKARDGILESEQIRRAIDAWLVTKGIKPPKRPAAPKRRRP